MCITLTLTSTLASLIQSAKSESVVVQFHKFHHMVLPNGKANGTNKQADSTVHQVKFTLKIKEGAILAKET